MDEPGSRRAGAAAFQAGPDTVVTFAYDLYDAEGELVERSADEPVTVLFGRCELAPALEAALSGLPAGAERSVRLGPADAFGTRDPGSILEVDRDDFPPDLHEGDELVAEDASGSPVPLKVLDVRGDVVVVDANHPLAGQTVRLELRILAVRPASSEEIAAAEARLIAGEETLIPLGRLVKKA